MQYVLVLCMLESGSLHYVYIYIYIYIDVYVCVCIHMIMKETCYVEMGMESE